MQQVRAENGTSTVVVAGQVIALSEVAAAILDATPTDGDVALEQLTEAVVAAIGPPPPPLKARDVVEQQVHDLVAHYVLRTGETGESIEVTAASVSTLRSVLRHAVSTSHDLWHLAADVSGGQLLAASERHRVTPTIARARDRLSLPAAASARLAAGDRQERATVGVLAQDLSRALDRLDTAGIRCISFKGLALAVQAHGDVAARGTGDLDLLVHPADLELAHRVLGDVGWRPVGGYPVPGPSWAWRHFIRHGNELSLASDTSVIDLHWHLNTARSAFPAFDELWSETVRVDVLGRDVPTLSPYDALAHSASHSAKDGWAWLRGLLDVHLLAADRRTWSGATRPLRQDQLLTLGLAARIFGIPTGAPALVHDAMGLAESVWPAVLHAQSVGGASHETSAVPGIRFGRVLRSLRWAGADARDLVSHVSYSAMPPWLTYEESSPHGAVVVPRVLARRTAASVRRARAARGA